MNKQLSLELISMLTSTNIPKSKRKKNKKSASWYEENNYDNNEVPKIKKIKLDSINASGWTETNISSPISLSTETEINSESFDPNGELAEKIISKIKKQLKPKISKKCFLSKKTKIIDSNSSVFCMPEKPLENFREYPLNTEADQIEVLSKMDAPKLSFFDSDTDSDSTTDDEIRIAKILKHPKRFTKQCEINVPKYKTKYAKIPKKEKEPKKKLHPENKTVSLENHADILNNEISVKPKIKPNKSQKIIESPDENLSEDGFSTDNDLYEDNTILPKQNPTESIKFYVSKNHCIFFLKHPSKIHIQGKLSVSILSGGLNILGYNYTETDNIEIYSPKGTNIFLETIQKEKNKNINMLLKKYDLSEKILRGSDDCCVLVLKNIDNNLTKSLDKYILTNIFPKISSISDDRFLSLSEMKLQTYFDVDSFQIKEDWIPIAEKLKSSNGSVMVCGGKGVGKSSLLRYMVNMLLNTCEKVLYIDLDPGQSEFTVPGCVSVTIVDKPLFGPSFSHIRKPEKCIFVGEVNITHCFNRYIDSVKQLITHCKTHLSKPYPTVINYMGFTKSLGISLAKSIIQTVSPSTLVQIQSSNPKLNFPSLLTKEYVSKNSDLELNNFEELEYELVVLDSVVDGERKGADASVWRDASILGYFNQASNEDINNIAPYSINLSSITLRHIDPTITEDLPLILNGNLVALCTSDSSNCLGFGIVRGIDPSSNKLYLSSPESPHILEKVDTLVMGSVSLPELMYKTTGYCDAMIPYVSMNLDQQTTQVPKRSYRACKFLLKK